jgi:hypothetical protein
VTVNGVQPPVRGQPRRAWLANGTGAVFPVPPPAAVPMQRSGVLLGEVETAARAAVDAGLSGPVGSGVELRIRGLFVVVPAGELAAVAVTLGKSTSMRSVVACPEGVAEEATVLAGLVGALLLVRRGRTTVTCGVRPPVLGDGCDVIAHPVWVEDGTTIEVRHVWELTGPGTGRDTADGPPGRLV